MAANLFRASDPVSDAAVAWATKAAAYATPWVITLAGAGGAQIAHAHWGGDPVITPIATMALAGVGAGLVEAVRRMSKGNKIRHNLYTLNTAALMAGMVTTTITGFTPAFVTDAWFLGGIALCVVTNLRLLLHRAGALKDEGKASKWEKFEKEVKTANYVLENVEHNGKGIVTADVHGEAGATAADFLRKLPALTSALRLGKGRMTVVEDPEDASHFQLRGSVKDLLAATIPWPGPSAFGQPIAPAPLPVGLAEDGEDVAFSPTGIMPDGSIRNLSHLLAMGMTGAGKSAMGTVALAEALTRTEVSVWGVNCSKPMQDFGSIVHGLDWFVTSEGEARAFFAALPNVIKARTEALAARGYKVWKPGCGLNFLIIWGEEAADFAADNAKYNKLLRTARSAGVWIVTSLQRATHTNISVDARNNHGSSMCFGLQDAGDAVYCLPDQVIEAGAVPDWADRKPGRAYVTGMGIPESRWIIPMRSYFATARQLADAITAAATIRTPLDEVTAKAAGAVYANRTRYTTPVFEDAEDGPQLGTGALAVPAPVPHHPTIPAQRAYTSDELPSDVRRLADALTDDQLEALTAFAEAAPGPEQITAFQALQSLMKPRSVDPAGPPSIEEIPGMDDDEVRQEVADLLDLYRQLAASDPEPDAEYANAKHDDDIPPMPEVGMDLAEDGDPLTAEQARSLVCAQLAEWAAEGKLIFTPRDLAPIWTRYRGDGRSWFNRFLGKLTEAGTVESSEVFGEYHLLRSPLEDNPE